MAVQICHFYCYSELFARLRTCILIGQHVCFHSAVKNEGDMNNITSCLQGLRINNFMEEIKPRLK